MTSSSPSSTAARGLRTRALLSFILCAGFPCALLAQWNDSLLKPFVLDHRAARSSPADVSFLLDAPAGKAGFVRIVGGHLVKPDGARLRLWGVHISDWSRGSVLLPAKEEIPLWAGTLARHDINCVRLHFLDLDAPRGIIATAGGDSQQFDSLQLDRLDVLVFELKKRGDVASARKTVVRNYSRAQVMDSRTLARTEQSYFTPGFPLATPLHQGVRTGSLDGTSTAAFASVDTNPIVSDTKEPVWYTSPTRTNGLVTVQTPRSEALIGFVKANGKALHTLDARIDNAFASLVLTSLDSVPMSRAGRMLLTAGSRVSNTGLTWNADRTRVLSQGESPSLIEPVTGTITLRRIEDAVAVSAAALDGAGNVPGPPIPATRRSAGWTFPIGSPVTTWYVISVTRRPGHRAQRVPRKNAARDRAEK